MTTLSKAADIAYRLSTDDAQQLKLLNRGLRTNEALPHKMESIDRLITQGLAQSSGMAVRITELGYEVLEWLK